MVYISDENCILVILKADEEDMLSPVRHAKACLPLRAEVASDGL
jgi:hypothetical protein